MIEPAITAIIKLLTAILKFISLFERPRSIEKGNGKAGNNKNSDQHETQVDTIKHHVDPFWNNFRKTLAVLFIIVLILFLWAVVLPLLMKCPLAILNLK